MTASERLRLKTLNIDFHQGGRSALQHPVKRFNRQVYGSLTGERHMIDGVLVERKSQNAGFRPNAHLMQCHQGRQFVEANVRHKTIRRIADGFERYRRCSCYAACQHAIGTGVGSDVDEKIAGTQKVQSERHVRVFSEAIEDIARDAGFASPRK